MQNRHLRKHSISRFWDDNASGPIENAIFNDDAAAHWQAVHEATVFFRVGEPGFIHTPVQMLFT